ncbi:MAG TPA: methyltransferase domain-containing protein [Acidobacteriota bacterium]|nr:methyltransferase domain-containing protein [Acidobacteriota bacterium]
MGRKERVWQLEMFGRSLKKQQKLSALRSLGSENLGQDRLLLTCGDNNGALNYYFREHGGRWTWGDVTGENVDEISALLGEPVHRVPVASFPFRPSSFDGVVAVDVLEHLDDDQPFLSEVLRVLRPGGRAVVTVPNGDPRLLANRVKWGVGMTPEVYGHVRPGYTVAELSESLRRSGMAPVRSSGYSRFFTEMVELAINFTYVRLLSRGKGKPKSGRIAPVTSAELQSQSAAYRLYTLTFPLLRLLSRLDGLLARAGDCAVIVVAAKPSRSEFSPVKHAR